MAEASDLCRQRLALAMEGWRIALAKLIREAQDAGEIRADMEASATAALRADFVSFGRPFICNPDLVRRFRESAPLNKLFEDAPLYGGDGPHGYVDYPALADWASRDIRRTFERMAAVHSPLD